MFAVCQWFASSSLAEVQAEKVHYKNILRKVRKSVPFDVEISDDEDNIHVEPPGIGSGRRY
eukprot:COSAG02_NODE_20422_length_832_cov_1.485675_2_plen_61_part_00